MTFQKFDHGKPRMSLIPPDAARGLAEVLTHGAAKYGAHNWAQGADWSRYLDAAFRHLNAYTAGEDIDPDSGLPHIDQAQACIAFLSAYQKRGIGNDDRQRICAVSAPVVDVSKPPGFARVCYVTPDQGGL